VPGVETVRTAELLGRLERRLDGRAPGRLAVASDCDGTLWSGDVGEAMFERLLAERAVREEALAALAAEAERYGVDAATTEPNALTIALYQAFQRGGYPEGRAYELMAWAFAGWSRAELAALADRVLDAFALERAADERRATHEVLAWAERRGLEVWLVSASHVAVVKAAAARLGLGRARVVAMTPAEEHGVQAPRIVPPAPNGDGKVAAIRSAAPALELVAALGNSVHDAAMLAAAELPIAVAPEPGLRTLALAGLVELVG
jgi:phosphoserine phosphatase